MSRSNNSPIGFATGSPSPTVQSASLIGGQADVLTLLQLAYPDPDFDPAPALRTLITALLARPGPARPGSR